METKTKVCDQQQAPTYKSLFLQPKLAAWLVKMRQVLTLSATLLFVVGCGGNAHELETAPVSGTVTLDGKPLPNGFVYIVPAKGRMAKGVINQDGSFVVGTYEADDGAQVGTHNVTVVAIPLGEGEKPAPGTVPIPPKYSTAKSSGLTIDVKAGEDNFKELKLSSK